jgi:hypothetical protein
VACACEAEHEPPREQPEARAERGERELAGRAAEGVGQGEEGGERPPTADGDA